MVFLEKIESKFWLVDLREGRMGIPVDAKVAQQSNVPLVVDLDGTLIKVDTLHEALIELAARQPLGALQAFWALRHGRAAFKAAVADRVVPDVATVPVNDVVREAIERARQEGRKIYLATAADRRYANAIAAAIGGFEEVFASENGVNLKGKAKADRLTEAFGVKGFDYVGNDAADIPVWQAARTAISVEVTPSLARQLDCELPNSVSLSVRKLDLRPCLSALRPHQWLKNALLALPAIAGHEYSVGTLVTVLIAFASFSFCASGVYLVNDMLDLSHDRAHPEKRHRALAAGALPVGHSIALLALLASMSIALTSLLPLAFAQVLAVYFLFSMLYALYLKRKLMIDVVALAALYGIRVVAGGVATGIVLSDWLVAFCFFIFLSLALVKRAAEVMTLPEASFEKLKGRGYRRIDIATVNALTAASGFVAVLVLALYINSPDVRTLYHRPQLLWGVCVVLVYWLGRVCFLAGRGEMRQDPVVFTAVDRVSWLSGLLVAAIFVLAL